jgi:hypothetical protein
MKTREAFQLFCNSMTTINPSLTNAFWDKELKWEDDQLTDRLRNEIIGIQQTCGADLDRLTAITAECLKDILALRRSATLTQALVLNLLQIDISLSVMGTAYAQKRLQLIFDWVIYSVCDAYPYELENHFELSRIADLFQRDRPAVYQEWGRAIGLQWLGIFYYYVFNVGGHKEVARLLAPLAIRILTVSLPAEDAVDPAVRVADWAIRDEYPGRAGLIEKLRDTFEMSPIGTDNHMRLGISLALLIGKEAGMDTKEQARKLLSDYEARIPPNWRLQLLQVAFQSDADQIEISLERIVKAIQDYRNDALAIAPDSILVEYEFERSFTLIIGMFLTCVRVGRTDAAAALIAAWKGLSTADARKDALFMIPNHAGGTFYSRRGAVHSIGNSDHETTFVALLKALNEFHGTNVVLHDDESLDPNIATRPGLPEDPEFSSNQYVEAMGDHFRFYQARDFLMDAKQEGVGALRVIPGMPCPVQALMVKELGFSWPLASSIQHPGRDREVRTILIWNAGTLIAEQQLQWITEVLGPDVEVCVRSGDIETFRAEYSNETYDVIWLTTHGEFDHNDPHRSSLQLSDSLHLNLDEFITMETPQTARRLLVLDACDSGAVPVYGGLSDLGFGPLLSARAQAVICHRWPVEQFPSAVFNVLLADCLRSHSFYAAYQLAMSTFAGGREAIIGVLSATLGEAHDLVSRIRANQSVRWNTLAIWGSAAFLE